MADPTGRSAPTIERYQGEARRLRLASSPRCGIGSGVLGTPTDIVGPFVVHWC